MVMNRYSRGLRLALAVVALAAAPPVSAQEAGRFGSAGESSTSPLPPGGWNITPSLLYSGSWDDNVLLKGRGDSERGDFLNVLNPRGEAEFTGRRGQFLGRYDGAFLLYRDLNTLDSYDQHASVAARRLLSKHVTLFVNDSLALTPTTELSLLIGVPFLRTGTHVNDLRTGIEADLTKRTSLTLTYQFEWVRFDQNPALGASLPGGHSHGGLLFVRHKLSDLTALTIEYDRQFSTVGGPETFDVQNAAAGFERRLSEAVRIYAAAGLSRLAESVFGPSHISPRYHAGVSQRLRTGSLDVVYDRSFAPAFGFGGTTESKDLSVRLNMPLSRRVYTQSTASWRSNTYLLSGDTSLRSRWLEASIGYLAQPWVRIEGFYGGAYQTTTLPGGVLDRNRFGFQVITAKPVRIR
jgi:hypothetical protein